MLETSGAEITQFSWTLQNSAIFQVAIQRAIAAAQQNIGLDSDAEQFLNAVLRRLGLQFPGGVDERNQGQMDEDNVFRT
jgi:hypothetical protein